MKRATSLSLPLLALSWGCGPRILVASPDQAAASLRTANEVVFAYELSSVCELQQSSGAQLPKHDEGWSRLSTSTWANQRFEVTGKTTLLQNEGGEQHVSAALQLSGKSGTMWVRNVPKPTADAATRAWSCVLDRDELAAKMPKLTAPIVQLTPMASSCEAITPIFGDMKNVTFAPYTVSGRGLYATGTGVIVGVRLEADGGDKALTVPAATLDRCFAAADHAPPPPREARALSAWLDNPSQEPPSVSADTFFGMTGLKAERCMREGTGLTTHHECRAPILRMVADSKPGAYGPPTIRIERQRVVDGMHVYAKRLISATDVIDVLASPRLRGSSPSVIKAFNTELEKSVASSESRAMRAANGFRLLRTGDSSSAVQPTHVVNVELDFAVGDTTTVTQTRIHKYSAGRKSLTNPRVAELAALISTKQRELQSAQQALESAKQLAATAGKVTGDLCEKGASEAASNLPFGLGAVASAAAKEGCKAGTQTIITTAEADAVSRAQKELLAAQSELTSTPSTISASDDREYEYEAKILKRNGQATARMSIATASGGAALFSTSMKMSFSASDEEIPESPEHLLVGKKAKLPSQADVEQELARTLVQRVDAAMLKWAAQRQIGGDIGDLKPGTRSWMVAVARNAASDRPVKLLSDVLESRPEELAQKFLELPVTLPKVLDKRCFTLAAVPLDPLADTNMQVGRIVDGRYAVLAQDVRGTSESGFEVCDLPEGTYSVRVAFASDVGRDKGVLVSMFDSTPGVATNQDVLAASRGLPTTPRKGEELTLNGEGVVQYRGSNNTLVTGRPGDRDGDGVLDDDDHCPYDPETKNDYLDDDGCPDVAPGATTK